MEYKRKKQLTTSLISMNHVERAVVKVIGYSEEMKVESLVSKDGTYPMVYRVINLETGEESKILAGTVMRGVFEDYKDELLGKCFEINAMPKMEGKKYLPLQIWEIDEPGDDE